MNGYFESPLTEVQQGHMKQRQLLTGKLLVAGASIDAHGRLTLRQSQLERAQKGQKPFEIPEKFTEEVSPGWPEAVSSDMQAWLTKDVITAFDDMVGNGGLNRLDKMGLKTVRDVFVAGRKRVSDIDRVGPQTIEEIERAANNNGFGLVMLNQPKPVDIAKICDQLSQVHAMALNTWLGISGELSVEDVLAKSDDELKEASYAIRTYTLALPLPEVREAAAEFAAEFTEIKSN